MLEKGVKFPAPSSAARTIYGENGGRERLSRDYDGLWLECGPDWKALKVDLCMGRSDMSCRDFKHGHRRVVRH